MKLKAMAAVAALGGVLWILQGILLEPRGLGEDVARSTSARQAETRVTIGEGPALTRDAASRPSPSALRVDPARAPSGVVPLSSKVEIALTLDGVRCPRPQIRFRRAEDAGWTLAEVNAERAQLPFDPRGEEHLVVEVLGPKGEPLDAAWRGFEDWDELTTTRELFAANAEWAYRGRLLEGHEELLELYAFTHRKIRGRVLDEEGRPASGAEVNVRGLRTFTDAKGDYALDLPPRAPAWHVTVHARDGQGGFGSASVEEYSKFSGPAAEGVSRVDIELGRGLQLRGTVRDEEGDPLVAEVKVAGCEPVRSSATDGTFLVRRIPPDPGQRLPRAQRRVVVSLEGYRSLTFEQEVRSGGYLECVLIRTRSLRGRVVDALGQPLEGVRVAVSDRMDREILRPGYSGDEQLSHTKSDSRGRFELQVGDDQRYLAALSPDRPYRLWALGSAPGEVELTLPAGAKVSGRLVDSLGEPREGLDLTATLPGEPSPSSQSKKPRRRVRKGLLPVSLPCRVALDETEGNGSFSLNVPAGHYDLHLGDPTRERAPLIRGVAAGGPPLTLTQESPSELGQVQLRVRSSAGVELEAEVFVKPKGADTYGYGKGTAEDRIELWLNEGAYELWISAPGHLPLHQTLSVSSSRTHDLGTLTLELGGGTLEVKLPNREPFGALWVRFRDSAGGPRRQIYADTSCSMVRITGLTPGSVTLSAELIDEDMDSRANYESTYPAVGPMGVAVQASQSTEVTLPLPE